MCSAVEDAHGAEVALIDRCLGVYVEVAAEGAEGALRRGVRELRVEPKRVSDEYVDEAMKGALDTRETTDKSAQREG